MTSEAEMWDARLRAAGWLPGDRYDYANPTVGIRTSNLRLILWNSGRWSKRLVDGITEGHILSRYRCKKGPRKK